MSCKIRDKAQRPSAFISQPCKRLTSSTPELHAQLNLTRVSKKKWPHLESMSCCLEFHVKGLRPVSWDNRRIVVAASNYAANRHAEKRWGQSQRPTDSTLTRPMGENWSKASCCTLPRRITNSKVSIQSSFQSVNSLLRQAFPEGFMPPWRIQHESHTCSETSLRILMWNASDVQKHSS